MSIRFLADADLSQGIVKGVRQNEPAFDIMSATEAHLEGLSDLDVLSFAASEGRIVVSHDTSTITVHFANFLRMGNHSPGLLLVRQQALSYGQVIEALLMIWSASQPEEWVDQIYYLPSLARHVFRR